MFTIWFGSDWFGQWFGSDEENGFVSVALSGSGTLAASLTIVEEVAPPTGGGSGSWKRAIVVQKKRDSNREIEELVACGAV